MNISFKQYYMERLQWIFRYTCKNIFYCLGKTLCLIVGIPIYAVMFALEMVLTFVNMLFCWIPILGMVIGVICKAIIYVIDKTFFICILTDLGKWIQAHKQEISYDITDDEPEGETAPDAPTLEAAEEAPNDESAE